MRKTDRYPVDGPNALWQIYRTVSKWKAVKNFVWIQVSRYCPSLPIKNWIYRRMLGMEVGEHTAFALMVMVDVFFPEKIKIGRNSIIGYNTTILAHEYLINEYRLGEVRIGSNVMVGANTTILPGVTIGDGAVIGAGSVVHKDVEPYSFVAGNPLRVIRTRASDHGEAGVSGTSAENTEPDTAYVNSLNKNSSSS
ncbi:DapH/DapD/GlmU-related protein [Paenibacillus sp. UNC499MF]|uniref:acyltransferase n=1 Tax=Paenibacillus sp. UNC499MF TaxID=1502751 RepID=UPI0008A00300|nr:acyltransferase [Paenibacillus sp. UNC499MF]SEG79151.1 Acetyltransferase (isoleucine patch superfamily) [Paenibacillus sp. UNC499MF]